MVKMVRESDFPPDGFDHAQICPEGHVVTSSFYTSPEFGEEYCSTCGKQTLTACSSCSTPIRGSYRASLSARYKPPAYCRNCGVPFPWTATAIEEWRLLADMFEGVTDDERARLKASIDDIIVDSPGTPRTVLTLKRLLPKVGNEAYGAARTILLAVATAAAKEQMGL